MAEQNREKQQNRANFSAMRPGLRALLLVLFAAFSLSTGLLGFLLGRNATRSTGQLLDTIVLSPGDPSLATRTSAVVHYLTGRLRYEDGSPGAGLRVELREEGKSDVTDSEGKFYFSGLQSGLHVLQVQNDAGDVLSNLELSLDFSGGEVSADISSSSASFHMPEETRLLELTLTVEEDSGLLVDADRACFVTKDGQVVNFEGAALQVQADSHAVTAQGNLVDSAGFVMIPAQALAITPQGEALAAAVGEETAPGLVLEEDGAVQTKEGARLLPDGEVVSPEGETAGGEETVVLITEEEIIPLEELPEEYTPPVQSPLAFAPVAQPLAADPVSSASTEEAADGDSGEEEPAEPEESRLNLNIVDQDGSGLTLADRSTLTWEQRSTIDLFKNRYRDLGLGEQDGIPVIAPGSSGYYYFRLENPEEFDVVYTISLEECSFHLPMRFSVFNARGNKSYLYHRRTAEEGAIVSQEITIPAGGTQNLRIDWEWEYEDWYRSELDDQLDISAASNTDGMYLLALDLVATQALEEYAGGETQYPGRR